MNELNEHKKDAHSVPYSRPEKSSVSGTISHLQKNNASDNSMENGTSESSFTDTSSGNRASMLNQNPCM